MYPPPYAGPPRPYGVPPPQLPPPYGLPQAGAPPLARPPPPIQPSPLPRPPTMSPLPSAAPGAPLPTTPTISIAAAPALPLKSLIRPPVNPAILPSSVAAAAQARLAGAGLGVLMGPEKKHTTVYVGKIAESVGEDFITSLLETCGEVKSWKRVQDPETKKLKSFGFCEYEDAESVLRAMRILNKYELDGQPLLLNVNQATQKYLNDYVANKDSKGAVPTEPAPVTLPKPLTLPPPPGLPPPPSALISAPPQTSKKDADMPEADGEKPPESEGTGGKEAEGEKEEGEKEEGEKEEGEADKGDVKEEGEAEAKPVKTDEEMDAEIKEKLAEIIKKKLPKKREAPKEDKKSDAD
ncbi:hypothetical protein CYMTET_3159, partial [Cymbomonas tetramitiformis]